MTSITTKHEVIRIVATTGAGVAMFLAALGLLMLPVIAALH